MSPVAAYQQLGDVEELLAQSEQHAAFAFPEFAQVTPLLADGSSQLNFLVQSGAPSVTEARKAWQNVSTADMLTIQGYAVSKDIVPYIEEDGTSHAVIVLDFSANERWNGVWDVSARLIDTEESLPS